jgi:hypothetical protein
MVYEQWRNKRKVDLDAHGTAFSIRKVPIPIGLARIVSKEAGAVMVK